MKHGPTIIRFIAAPLLVAVIALGVVGLRSLGQGQGPSFTNLTFPANNQTLDEGEVFICGRILAPNGISQGPVLRRENLTLQSWDEVRLDIEGQSNFFDITYEWPNKILQPGEVVLSLTAVDNLGLRTTISSTVNVTPNEDILALDQELKSISQQRGDEVSSMYATMGLFLSRSQAFQFDASLAALWATLVGQTSGAGLSQANPWKPHILAARNAVALVSAPDQVASTIKADTISFLDYFYGYAETQDNNYMTWIPAPNKDLPLLEASVGAYEDLAVSSSVIGNIGSFQLSIGERELFSLTIDLSSSPPAVQGTVYGQNLTQDQRLHPILATRPVIDDVYLANEYNLLQNTFDKGGY